ncbi:MAG: HIT domain-containing protein [Rhizobiales bacterium]|nr:HIT domain-containing protein [Hyphomicrobiales bacterium]
MTLLGAVGADAGRIDQETSVNGAQNSAAFEVAPRIAAESVPLLDLRLCHVRLMDDARYPWLILLPRRPGLEEWTALSADDQSVLSHEIAHSGKALGEAASFDKLNVAALGNIVRQMHVHVVGRRIDDAAWPDPVFGRGVRVPYAAAQRDDLAARLIARLKAPHGVAAPGPADR